ncbi:MAG: hypothetical protein ACP5MZ_01685 [Candidatus Micrarchaeia archaeon]
MDSIIDNLVAEVSVELLKERQDREKILKLAEELDSQSSKEGKARYNAALAVVKKVYRLEEGDFAKRERPTAKTLASSLLELKALGLSDDDIKKVIAEFPSILNLSEEYIEKRREYFGYTKEEFAKIVSKFPSIVGSSEEHIEKRREYFGYTKEEFAKIVSKFPSIVGSSEEYIEKRREYFGYTKEEFAKIVSKSINVISNSEEYIEKRREYFGYTKEEFAKIVSKSISVLSNSEEYIEKRRKYLRLDMKAFSKLVYTAPGILSLSEDNLEKRFDWYRRHFRIGKDELVARMVEKPALYFSLFDRSFYARVLLRTKAMTAGGKALNDVRDIASVLKFNEKEFVEKHGNGIDIDSYNRLKELARVTEEANKRKSKSKA